MMGKSMWGVVGMVVLSCLPLMGVRERQAWEELDGTGFLNLLRKKIPSATVGWDDHREEYLRTQTRIDFLLGLKREPNSVWNIDLHRQRTWSLIFREIANMWRFGQDLVQEMQRVGAFAQAVMELEEAQQNGELGDEEMLELRRRVLDTRRDIMYPFTFEETDANIMRLRAQVDEDERYLEAHRRWLAGIERPE